jgi:hypothetical protein
MSLRKTEEPQDYSKSGLDVQAANALRRGDTQEYQRLLKVKREVGQADDRPSAGADPEVALLRKDLLRMQVERAGEPKDPNQAQFTASGYAGRMEQAESTFQTLESDVAGMNLLSFEAQQRVPAALQSATMQSYMQAARNFINAVLRRESGAVISPSEFAEARQQYLPQPGDTPETLAQKSNNRQYVFSTMKRASGPAYEAPVKPPTKRRIGRFEVEER